MNIFSEKDTKSFLKAYISELPRRGRGEITKIANYLGVSPTLISQVLSGDNVLTPEQGQGLAKYLQLAPLETEYLAFLLQRERAGTVALREFWTTKLNEIKQRSFTVAKRVSSDRELTDTERAKFYSSTIYPAISLFTSLEPSEKGKSMGEICERFSLSRAKASEILSFLVETGICQEKNGCFVMGVQKIHLEDSSPFVLRHHTNWRLKAIQAAENLEKQELMYSAPVSLSRADFEILREEMVGFVKQFLKKVHASPADEIACFNLDFFWLKK